MAQALVRRLKDDTLGAYRLVAQAKGTSLEAELRDVIERNRPLKPKDSEALLRRARDLLAMTPPDGPADTHDSTLWIRWDRDTDHGRWIDDGWADHLAGR